MEVEDGRIKGMDGVSPSAVVGVVLPPTVYSTRRDRLKK